MRVLRTVLLRRWRGGSQGAPGHDPTRFAMWRPAIEDKDGKALSAMPGIGPATADRIIAKLRRKVPKFALMVAREEKPGAEVGADVVSETYEVLISLGHSESDARNLLDTALSSKKKFKDTQSLLEAIYQHSHKG